MNPSVSANQPSILQLLWTLPFFTFFQPSVPSDTAPSLNTTAETSFVEQLPACTVEPLEQITAPEAVALEAGAGSALDVEGLTVPTSRALTRFETVVRASGGRIWITSAHRPAAYQQHLRNVWEKWMLELRNNTEEACQPLRTEVQAEFVGHQLLESQRPVVDSDHTRGIGFDAAVQLPARRGRFRKSVDQLARAAHLMRPDVWRDPVHFRLIGARI